MSALSEMSSSPQPSKSQIPIPSLHKQTPFTAPAWLLEEAFHPHPELSLMTTRKKIGTKISTAAAGEQGEKMGCARPMEPFFSMSPERSHWASSSKGSVNTAEPSL